jgi:hypothetical protein
MINFKEGDRVRLKRTSQYAWQSNKSGIITDVSRNNLFNPSKLWCIVEWDKGAHTDTDSYPIEDLILDKIDWRKRLK